MAPARARPAGRGRGAGGGAAVDGGGMMREAGQREAPGGKYESCTSGSRNSGGRAGKQQQPAARLPCRQHPECSHAQQSMSLRASKCQQGPAPAWPALVHSNQSTKAPRNVIRVRTCSTHLASPPAARYAASERQPARTPPGASPARRRQHPPHSGPCRHASGLEGFEWRDSVQQMRIPAGLIVKEGAAPAQFIALLLSPPSPATVCDINVGGSAHLLSLQMGPVPSLKTDA